MFVVSDAPGNSQTTLEVWQPDEKKWVQKIEDFSVLNPTSSNRLFIGDEYAMLDTYFNKTIDADKQNFTTFFNFTKDAPESTQKQIVTKGTLGTIQMENDTNQIF